MKKKNVLKSVTILIMFCFTFNVFATNESSKIKSKENKVWRAVARSVSFPSIKVSENVKTAYVYVDFRINEDGRIIVNQINGTEKFTEPVKQQLEKTIVKKVPELTGKSFIYKFVFKK